MRKSTRSARKTTRSARKSTRSARKSTRSARKSTHKGGGNVPKGTTGKIIIRGNSDGGVTRTVIGHVGTSNTTHHTPHPARMLYKVHMSRPEANALRHGVWTQRQPPHLGGPPAPGQSRLRQ